MSHPIDRDAKANDLFARALEVPEHGRADFLSESCGDDPELRAVVERLLRASAEPDALLETGGALKLAAISGLGGSEPHPDRVRPGQTLAHYEIVGELGAGGMGEVFVAEDTKLERLA